MRVLLISMSAQGLVVNQTDYKKYSGLWSNVRTNCLSAAALHYPSLRPASRAAFGPRSGALPSSPLGSMHYWRIMRQGGWEGRYQREVRRWQRINTFRDFEGY